MSLFQDILAQLSKRLENAQGHTQEIAQVVSEIVGVIIVVDQITVKNGVLYITVSPTIKTAVRFKQERLLSALKMYGITTIG